MPEGRPEANIYQRLMLITQEIAAVAKNLSVGVGQSKYKAVGEADVLAAVKPIEAKHGVYSYPADREIIESTVLTTQNEYNGRMTEKKLQFIRIKTVYRFVNIDKPDEYVEIISYGDGVDSQDKAPGKAMTYADKYALLKAYKIITGEDPDQEASQKLKGKGQEQRQPVQRQPVRMASSDQISQLKRLGCSSVTTKAYIVERVKAWDQLTAAAADEMITYLNVISSKDVLKNEKAAE